MYKTGDRVRITRLTSDDGSCAHFIGRTGTVTGVEPTYVTVKGIGNPPEKSWGFLLDEVTPA